VLGLPVLQEVRGKRIVVFRGSGGRELLATVLAERGASVEYAECYRRIAAPVPAAAPAWAATPLHAVTVSSAEALGHVVAALGRWRPEWTGESVLIVPHARVGEAAARLGVRNVILAGAGDAEIATRLVAYFRDAK
jgi:uroporphyrinogen-III synthase